MEEEQVVSADAAEEKVEAPVEETSAEETAPKQESEQEIALPPPKKKTAQERIDEITRARREAEREREYWKSVAMKETPAPAPPPPQTGLPARPVISNYDTTEAYEDALLEWNDNRRDIQTRTEQIKQRNIQALTSFNQKAEELRQQYDDFDEVVEQPVFSPAMRAAILQSENGPEVAYFLGRPENRLTADRILTMPVERQLYELGKLEQNLLIAKKTRRTTTAPAPITPVGITGGAEKDPSKMSIDEWMKWDRDRQMEKLKKKYGGT